MKLIRRAATLAAAAAIAVTGLIAPNASAQETDVYTVPGGHQVNGRIWQTSCDMYSSTVVRCRTDIYAQVVVREGSRYVTKTDFFFNNLTYLPSDRSKWSGNPLATPGNHTIDGRQWKTECDTAATGRGACRSYIKAKFAAYEGGKYVTKNEYIFNNMVKFARGNTAPVTSIPAHSLDQSKLDFQGIAGLQLGTSNLNLDLLGYAQYRALGHCDAEYRATKALTDRGIDFHTEPGDGYVWLVSLSDPASKTVDGASVGMTVGEVKALYGSRFKVVTKTNYGVTQYFGSVVDGDRELLFRVDGPADTWAPTAPLADSDRIAEIQLAKFRSDVSFDGC